MDGKPVRQPTPQVKTFNCERCGSPIKLRGMLQTTSVVCASCGSVIDVTDENLQIISTFQQKIDFKPTIPLGTRGKLREGVFEVIGYMRRKIVVEGVAYRWHEYLLFNPYKGFRWLSEYNGHWSYIKSTLHRPRIISDGNATFKGTTFRHFQSATAEVDRVAGEFYWRVSAGEKCVVQDFVAPPQILSMEQTGNEITWSVGEYVEPGEIAQAFKLKNLPARIGVGACQPSPHGNRAGQIAKLAAAFIAVAVIIQLVSVLRSENRLIFEDRFAYNTTDTEKSRVTDIFEVPGRTSNIVVNTTAPVSNSWVYFSMALINDDTGTAYDFGREISYYYGTDEDGPWTEGNQSDSATLIAIPAGRYYLRIEPDGPTPTQYSIRVVRDTPVWWPFIVTLVALSVMPLIAVFRSHSFEVKRWSESDHPMWTSSSDDDDGDDE